MLARFPHTLTYQSEGNPGGWDDENGVPIPETPGEDITVKCRIQPNVRQGYVVREDDGQKVEFNWLIHMDKSSERIPFGKNVIIEENGNQIASGTIIRSHKNQLHNQSWI